MNICGLAIKDALFVIGLAVFCAGVLIVAWKNRHNL